MSQDGKLHASGDLERRVRVWWKDHGMNGEILDIHVCGDGSVNVFWRDADEDGKYSISGESLYESI